MTTVTATEITAKQLNRYYQDNVKLSQDNTKRIIEQVIPLVNDILRYINKQDSRFASQAHCIGSYWQGLKVDKADEFDINVPISGCPKVPCGSSVTRCFGFDKPDIPDPTPTIDETIGIVKRHPLPPPKPGYVCISLSETPASWKKYSDTWLYDGNLIPFLVKKTFKRHLTLAIRDLPNCRERVRQKKLSPGPALTIRVYVDKTIVNVDFAPTMEGIFDWPVDWPQRRSVAWPSDVKIAEVKSKKLSLVPSKNFDWWVSYAEPDNELFNKIDFDGGCRKQCLRMMKKLRSDVWCPTTKPVITSYHLKNVLWWECHANPQSHQWSKDKLCDRFFGLVRRLLQCAKSRDLRFYFNPVVNLLSQKRGNELDIAATKIQNFLDNPIKCLS